MPTNTMGNDLQRSLEKSLSETFAYLMRAYMECGDEIQRAVLEMTRIVNDPCADEDDRQMALDTIQEALFPSHHNGSLGADLLELETDGASVNTAEVLAELDRQEAAFADRVQALMQAQRINQTQLAERSGVGQPAISMLLARNCRPQSRTVRKLAAALGVSAQELWPAEK